MKLIKLYKNRVCGLTGVCAPWIYFCFQPFEGKGKGSGCLGSDYYIVPGGITIDKGEGELSCFLDETGRFMRLENENGQPVIVNGQRFARLIKHKVVNHQ